MPHLWPRPAPGGGPRRDLRRLPPKEGGVTMNDTDLSALRSAIDGDRRRLSAPVIDWDKANSI